MPKASSESYTISIEGVRPTCPHERRCSIFQSRGCILNGRRPKYQMTVENIEPHWISPKQGELENSLKDQASGDADLMQGCHPTDLQTYEPLTCGIFFQKIESKTKKVTLSA